MARERYLINAGEDTIHAKDDEPQTPKQKRDNWWYYHKGPLVVIVLVAALLFSIVYSVVSKVQPDYTVALMTSYSMSSSGIEELERCIAEYANDRNGDGRVEVSVVNYVFLTNPTSTEQAEFQEAQIMKFSADCALNESMIFFHDAAAFEFMESEFSGMFQYNDGTPMPEDGTDFSNAMRPWSDFKAFSNFVPEPPEDDAYTSEILTELYQRLRVSVRAAEGSSIEKSEKNMAYYDDSMKLYSRLLADEPFYSGEEE